MTQLQSAVMTQLQSAVMTQMQSAVMTQLQRKQDVTDLSKKVPSSMANIDKNKGLV